MSDTALVRDVEIVNRKGLHARASAQLAKLAACLPARAVVVYDGETADARSIMDLLCLTAAKGSIVTLSASGDGAEETLDALSDLIKDGFGELDDDVHVPAS